MQTSRRSIRIKVLQCLYAYEIAKDPIEKVKNDLLSEVKDKELLDFADRLIGYVLDDMKLIDNTIETKLKNWEYSKIALVDKIIMRMGVAEMLNFSEIPPKVTINECIEISKEFCSESSGKFINGLLDAILSELTKDDKLNKKGRGLLDLKKRKNAK